MARFPKLRLYSAGLLAFLLGVPLTQQAFGQEAIAGTVFLSVLGGTFGIAAAISTSGGASH